jgi:hypothetical protein|uniref:Uncharacterized protein n=1 Tax=viral metagenome TaxID=1070528 RepID=A0A6C0DZJ0_9ZZZZ
MELSKNNLKCLDKCHPPRETFIHPQTKKNITNNQKEYICSVSQYVKDNKKYYTDECKEIPRNKNILNSKIIINSYYKIYSMEDLLLWLDNNKELNLDTKIRIFNLGFMAYFEELVFIDNRMIDFISLICLYYIDKITKKIPQIDNNIIKSRYIGKAKLETFFTSFIKNNKNIIIEKSKEYKITNINNLNLALFIIDKITDYIIEQNTSSIN